MKAPSNLFSRPLHLIQSLTLVMALSFSLSASASAADKPNILFICIDDLVPTLGCYGDSTALTPEIDGLASQGITFLNHHCSWSVCGPSRVALSTSLTPEETGVIGFKPMRDPAILPDVITMPQHFKNNGYETACTGKFHDNRTVGDTTQPLDGDGQFPDGQNVDDPASWSIPYVKAAGGFSPAVKNVWDNSDLPDADYTDHKILSEGLTMMTTLSSGNKPFFLSVGFKKPHLAFVAPKRMWDKYNRENMPLADHTALPTGASTYNTSAITNNGEILGYEPHKTTGVLPTLEEQKDIIHGYYACVSWVDFLVGELLDHLAITDDPIQESSPGVKKKMSETTIVVIWGDHGFHLGDHGKWAKHTNMERGTSCPLIMYDPRSPNNGAKPTTPVSTLDIYPTLCELACLPIPTQPMSNTVLTGRPLRGRSLVPILDDPTASVNGGAVNLFSTSGGYGYAYRTERFRYIEWVRSNGTVDGVDLYDYTMDPLETKNLAADPAYAAIVYQLSRALRAEPSMQGATRLMASSATSTGSSSTIPFARIAVGASDDVTLSWPGSPGVCYDVKSSTTMSGSGSWSTYSANASGSTVDLTVPDTRRFFLLEFASNTPPRWHSDPVTKPDASLNMAYTGQSLSTDVTDPDAGSTVTFSKVSGPAWLTVASNGDLGGTPTSGDDCANYFTVRATDEHGVSVDSRLQITVGNAAPPSSANFTATHDTYANEANTTLAPGTRKYMEVREMGASNFERISFLKFAVTGVGTVQSAKLWLYVDGAGTNPEADNVRAYQVADNVWLETTLNWTNKPAVGASIGSASAPGATGGWFSIDVTSYVTGNGTFSIAVDEDGNSVGRLITKEESAGAFAPYLEITWN